VDWAGWSGGPSRRLEIAAEGCWIGALAGADARIMGGLGNRSSLAGVRTLAVVRWLEHPVERVWPWLSSAASRSLATGSGLVVVARAWGQFLGSMKARAGFAERTIARSQRATSLCQDSLASPGAKGAWRWPREALVAAHGASGVPLETRDRGKLDRHRAAGRAAER